MNSFGVTVDGVDQGAQILWPGYDLRAYIRGDECSAIDLGLGVLGSIPRKKETDLFIRSDRGEEVQCHHRDLCRGAV